MERLIIPVLTPSAGAVIAELTREAGLDVVGVAIDVGQAIGLDALRDIALGAGALRCHVVDRRDTLAEAVLWPALRAGALGVTGAPIVTALSMPVVAEVLVEICGHEGATAVAVWADEVGDRQRLRALLRAQAPSLGLVAVTHDAPEGVTRNLWARVEQAAVDAPPVPRPDGPGTATVTVDFERGLPIGLSGVAMPPAEIIDSLQTIADDHGVAPFSARDDAAPGRVWRVHAPAALVLARAMEAIAARTFDAPTAEVATAVAEAYATLVRDGAWGSPARAGLDAFADRVLQAASGAVTLHLAHGRIDVEA